MRKLFAVLFCCLPMAAYAWWSDAWNYRKEISFELSAAGANITGTASDVPVLVRLHQGNFGYFADTKSDGSDLRFVAGDVVSLEDQGRHVLLGIRGANGYARVTGAGGEVEALQSEALATGSWHHLAVTIGNGKVPLYVDGQAAAAASVQPVEIAGTLTLGNKRSARQWLGRRHG